MPIRINLLAEQQAAEEARRRDPVKRAIWIGSALSALMVLWCISLFFQVRAAREQLADYQGQFTRLDEEARQVKLNKAESDDAERRTEALDRYATNRFLWGNVLNDLQMAAQKVESIRIEEINGEHSYSTNAEVKTPVALKLPYAAPPSGWKFWKSTPIPPDYNALAATEFKALTNKLPYSASVVPLKMKLVNLVTNLPDTVTANIEVIRPVIATEDTTIIIRARDYNDRANRRIDAFSKALSESPYMKDRLRKGEGMGILLREIGKSKEDMLVSPSETYTPFTIEAQFEPRVFTSE